MSAPVRVISLCVVSRGRSVLVSDAFDSVKGLPFYRPLGGGVEAGETTEQAVVREFREEIGHELVDLRLLGTLENIFTYEGRPGHEIVFVYDGRFENEALYDCRDFVVREGGQVLHRAEWRPLDFFNDHHRLVPDGVFALLTSDACAANVTLSETQAIEAFAEAAKTYCSLLDAPVRHTIDAPWRQLARALSHVHAAALDLPDVFDEGAPELNGNYRPNAETLGEWLEYLPDCYWQVFQALQSEPEEPVCGSIADDLADIYGDLKRGLDLFHGGHWAAAAWDWRFHFGSHWGRHLVDAQRAVFLSGHD